jgi:hypothetical protein
MLRKRFIILCDFCGRAPNIVPDYQATSAGARQQARAVRWLRIPRGDDRDRSRGQRGMDVCPRCAVFQGLRAA